MNLKLIWTENRYKLNDNSIRRARWENAEMSNGERSVERENSREQWGRIITRDNPSSETAFDAVVKRNPWWKLDPLKYNGMATFRKARVVVGNQVSVHIGVCLSRCLCLSIVSGSTSLPLSLLAYLPLSLLTIHSLENVISQKIATARQNVSRVRQRVREKWKQFVFRRHEHCWQQKLLREPYAWYEVSMYSLRLLHPKSHVLSNQRAYRTSPFCRNSVAPEVTVSTLTSG